MLQSSADKNALGGGQVLGSGLPVETSLEIDWRVKCHIIIPCLSRRKANTPPPALEKPWPKDVLEVSRTVQPVSASGELLQFVFITVSVKAE